MGALLTFLTYAAIGGLNVEVTIVGDVPEGVQALARAELEVITNELGAGDAGEERLALTLVAGAIAVRCIVTRPATGATAEMDLDAGRRTFRPGLDELLLRLFPERAKRRAPVVWPEPAPAAPEPQLDAAPLVAAGVSAGLLIGGILLGAHASSGTDRLAGEPLSAAEYRGTADRVHAEAWAANVLFISAALSAALAAALLFDE